MTIGFSRIWLRRAGRFKLGRALALAMAALPNEVGSAVFAMVDLVYFLDGELSQIMTPGVSTASGEPVGIRTRRLRDTIFRWGSLQLVHFNCKDGM